MPYIITTYEAPPGSAVDWEDPVTRHATATLENARLLAHKIMAEHRYARPYGIPESGGMIGPLPDGTVIEVTPTDGETP